MPVEVEIKYGDGLTVEFPDDAIPRADALEGAMAANDGSFDWFIQQTLDEKFSGIRNFMRQFAGFDENLTELDKAALSTMMVPIVGDITGLAADIDMYTNDPESRTVLNGLLTAAGLLPLVPAASSLKKGADALDMTQEARLQRARDMGFDTDTVYYHGTTEDISAFDSGSYVTQDPDYASAYANRLWEEEGADGIRRFADIRTAKPNVLPLYIKPDAVMDMNSPENARLLKEFYSMKGTPEAADYTGAVHWEDADSFVSWLRDEKGIKPDAIFVDEDNYGGISVKLINTEAARSVNAAFDPEKKDSANLLAEIAGGAVLTGAVANEKKKKKDEGA